jgi:FAD/FMN-containing dehydrogenase
LNYQAILIRRNPEMNHTALSEFERVLGPKGYSTDPDVLAPWLSDWRGRYTGKAAAMLSPASTDEVSQIVKIAAAHTVTLVPQGGNSGMVAGATPDDSGDSVILSLRRMNAISGYNDDEGSFTCEAGVILQNLHDAAATKGRRFPLSLGGKGSATIGGLISTNAGGTQVLRHGTMRALVIGIEAVLPDGTIFHGLKPLKKDNRGYDLKHLMIGAEGTLGIVTAARLQTVPAMIDRTVVWAGVSSPQAGYELLRFMQRSAPSALEGFEILPQAALDDVVKHINGTRAPLSDPHPWHVLMELVQDETQQGPPSEIALHYVGIAMEKGMIQDAIISANETHAEAFWKIRDSIAEAERADGPAVQHDISVPVDAMARFITDESPKIEAAFPGTRVVAFGHLGDGNVHYHVKSPKDCDPDNWYNDHASAISSYVYDRVTEYDGSISAEHGIGQLKIGELARLGDPARLLVLRGIKAALDPHGIMNPGKLVPLAQT